MRIDKFTRGPWRAEVNPSNPRQWIVIASTHETVVHSVAGGKDHAESNASLIAAAPDLYETAKNLLAVCKSLDIYLKYGAVIQQAQDAIDKAVRP